MLSTNRILFALLFFTALPACSDRPPQVAAGADHPQHDNEWKNCVESIHPFWTQFRAAVLAEDMDAIADMTKLPMIIFGSEELSREEFKKKFRQVLKMPTKHRYYKDKTKTITMKELIKDISMLEGRCWGSETYKILDRWTFAVVPGGWFQPDDWRLVEVDTDDLQKP